MKLVSSEVGAWCYDIFNNRVSHYRVEEIRVVKSRPEMFNGRRVCYYRVRLGAPGSWCGLFPTRQMEFLYPDEWVYMKFVVSPREFDNLANGKSMVLRRRISEKWIDKFVRK